MRQHYYLYLDESGDFTHDEKAKWNKEWSPSLIGGILLKNTIPTIKKKNLFEYEDSHCKEEKADVVFSKFEAVDELNPKYIIFSNEECIKVINNNLTYQNIMAEGIIQLLTKLKAEEENGQIFLDVYIARRIIIGDNQQKIRGKHYDVVNLEAYMERLQERLIMTGNRAGIQNKEWKITLGSAIRDDMLKMADVVCNTYLTRQTKFKDAKYEKIRSVYADVERTYYFSVFQASILRIFQDSMADGRIGEAVTIICQCEDTELIEKYLGNVKERLQALSQDDLKVQYSYISALVTHFIKVERNYNKSIRLLNNLLEFFVPIFANVEKDKKLVLQFELDLNFYLLTVYTHNGDVKKSIECEEICDRLFRDIPFSMEMVDYKIRYSNRKVINKINQFAFKEAKSECESLLEQCKNVKDVLELMTDQDFSYEELGKAYSSLTQIYTFLLRETPSLYQEAVKASNCAIKEMQYELRQYQYRALLETEAGQFDKAFFALLVAAEVIKPEDIDMNEEGIIKLDKESKQLCKEMANRLSCNKNVYLVSNYIRLMAEGKIGGWLFADIMFEQYNSSDICKEISGDIEEYQHPYEIIYWKLAAFFAESNSWKAAMDNYSKALQVSMKTKNEITLRKIGFAVELEEYAYALKYQDKNAKKMRALLRKHYEELKKDTISQNMKELFGDFKDDLEEWKVYYDMSRRITY